MAISRGAGIIAGWLLTIGSVTAAPSVTPATIPKNLHVYDAAGNTYVDMPSHACSGVRYFLAPGHSKYDAIYSTLLAAQTAGKPVVLRFDGCNGNNQGLIIGVYLP